MSGQIAGLAVYPLGGLASYSAAIVALLRKAARGVELPLANVVVPDLGGEEFENTPRPPSASA
jgi:hypothetical protein